MRRIFSLFLAGFLCACATTPKTPAPISTPVPPAVEVEPEIIPPQTSPDVADPDPAPVIVDPTPPQPVIPAPVPAPEASAFQLLPYWASSDPAPALAAFKRTCSSWARKSDDAWLSDNHPEFGRYQDWRAVCASANAYAGTAETARAFFETFFAPMMVSRPLDGLMTGYYQPEIEARRYPNKTFREPILAPPKDPVRKNQPRDRITAATGPVIAFGNPSDVFFMQVQGSGILAFPDGSRVRAAYADNNGYSYTSIGRVLIERGEMTKTEASKQRIEAWMAQAGPVAARELINQNKRYIYFREETLVPGEGPLGASRVPLTAMGSMAVDESEYAYGLPVWVETTWPQSGGDYRGQPGGQLLITQDTGNAIRGTARGDVYFGSGFEAGDKAGVMKHPGRWTILLPRALAVVSGYIS